MEYSLDISQIEADARPVWSEVGPDFAQRMIDAPAQDERVMPLPLRGKSRGAADAEGARPVPCGPPDRPDSVSLPDHRPRSCRDCDRRLNRDYSGGFNEFSALSRPDRAFLRRRVRLPVGLRLNRACRQTRIVVS